MRRDLEERKREATVRMKSRFIFFSACGVFGALFFFGVSAEAGKPFEIIYQNDGMIGHYETYHFPRWQMVTEKTRARFEAGVDAYADSGVTSISYGGWSGTNSFNHPTEVGRASRWKRG